MPTFADIVAAKKTVDLQLVGLDGNAFSLMGAFQRQARHEGWSKEEIDAVLDECRKSDYDHLLCTLMEVCVPKDDEGEDDEEEDDEGEDDEEEDDDA